MKIYSIPLYLINIVLAVFFYIGCTSTDETIVRKRNKTEKPGLKYDFANTQKRSTDVIVTDDTPPSTESVVSVELLPGTEITAPEVARPARNTSYLAGNAEIFRYTVNGKLKKGNHKNAFVYYQSPKIVLPSVKLSTAFNCMTIHCTESGDIESAMHHHSQLTDGSGNHWQGLGYHIVIDRDGNLQFGFRWMDQIDGAHARIKLDNALDSLRRLIRHNFAHPHLSPTASYFNKHSIGVAIVANTQADKTVERMTVAQEQAIQFLHTSLENLYGKQFGVILHNALTAKACPGKANSETLRGYFKDRMMKI